MHDATPSNLAPFPEASPPTTADGIHVLQPSASTVPQETASSGESDNGEDHQSELADTLDRMSTMTDMAEIKGSLENAMAQFVTVPGMSFR